MAAHACLKNEVMEDKWYHNLMRWLRRSPGSTTISIPPLTPIGGVVKSETTKRGHTRRRFKCTCTPATCRNLYEPRHDKTNKMNVRPVKTQIAWASAQFDQSLRCLHKDSLGPSLPIKRTA